MRKFVLILILILLGINIFFMKTIILQLVSINDATQTVKQMILEAAK
jgi:hypothetical protein